MVWTIRIALIVLLSTLLYIYLLNILRFFRPSNTRAMITGPLPRIQQLGGKIAGVEATASLARTDALATEQVAEVSGNLANLVEYLKGLAADIGYPPPGEIRRLSEGEKVDDKP